jgi:uncharacterized protein (DUF427 family)
VPDVKHIIMPARPSGVRGLLEAEDVMKGGRQPGAGHPITIESLSGRVVVRIGEVVLAKSSNALTLREADFPPVVYVPREEIAMAELAASSTSTYCPYKGVASYFSTRDGDQADIAWSYEDPFEAMARIKGHLAFYSSRGVSIEILRQA